MIFVTLAGKPGSSAFFSNSTVPVSFSIRIAEGAAMVSAGVSAQADRGRQAQSRDRVRTRQNNCFMAPSESFLLPRTYECGSKAMLRFT